MTLPLVLASASPARRRLLAAAGIGAAVDVSGVDEDAVADGMVDPTPAELVQALADAKARAVAPRHPGALVLGCDSMFEVGGRVLGKPTDADEAVTRIRAQRNGQGTLHTGHCLIDTTGSTEARGVASTVVRFGPMTDAEVDAYVATGEPLAVAGAFTLDGHSAPFIDGVDGDPGNVIGCSLPLVRRLLAELGHDITDLWNRSAPA